MIKPSNTFSQLGNCQGKFGIHTTQIKDTSSHRGWDFKELVDVLFTDSIPGYDNPRSVTSFPK